MVTDKSGKIFDDRRKKNVEVETDRRKKAKTKNKVKQNKE